MNVTGLADALDEHLSQSVKRFDGKRAGFRVFRPLTFPEGGIAVSGTQYPGRTVDSDGHGHTCSRHKMAADILNGEIHD